VGALTAKYAFAGRACLATEDVMTHCGFCSIGCELKVRNFGDGSYFTTSNDTPGDYLCRYGRFGNELFIQSERIGSPQIREQGEYKPVGITQACQGVAEMLKEAAAKHGPESVGIFVSPELTNEELFLASRIAREAVGTNNVGSLAILSGAGRSGAMDPALGLTASTADRGCLAEADLIIANNTSMESDHLVLNVDVISPVRDGDANLIVSNSTLDPADALLGTLAVDPMRGRGTFFWNAVLQTLLDSGDLDATGVEGAEDFLTDRPVNIELAAAKSGVDEKHIAEAADLIRAASRIVIVHGTDRVQDAARGDMELFANLTVLLRKAGKSAEILLPRLLANSAGLEVMGADPAFAAGRVAAPELPGATDALALRRMLEDGQLKAAFIIGENPLEYDRTGHWFRNVEFLAAMDWAETETTRFADITLPGATFLETAGTRCNFEGEVNRFERAVQPPSGQDGVQVLEQLVVAFGLETVDNLAEHIDGLVVEKLGDRRPFYWNTGQERPAAPQARLVPVVVDGKTTSIQPALTHSQHYRKEIREVGTERFRVHHGL
jgi:formate dehydrogenase major subunit